MSLTLSPDELARFEAALKAALSPLEHPTLDAWRSELSERFKRLLEADAALFVLSSPGSGASLHSPEYSDADFAEYARRFPTDEGSRRAAEAGFEAFTQTLTIGGDWEGYHRDPMVNEFYKPRKVLDAAGYLLTWPEEDRCAVLELHRDRFGTDLMGEKGLTLLRLLLPAFKAGVLSHFRLAAARAEFIRSLDDLGQALLLADADGQILHATTSLGRLLANDPDGQRVQDEMVRSTRALALPSLAATKARPHPPSRTNALREVHTARFRYRLYASFVRPDVLGGVPGIAVGVERVAPEPRSDAELIALFGLTPREIQVARLLGDGRTNAAVARALGMSIHTAERHCEHILAKLRIGSRSAVRACIHTA